MKNLIMSLFVVVVSVSVGGCAKLINNERTDEVRKVVPDTVTFSKRDMARMLSSIPVAGQQMQEVHTAVSGSSRNGYDEEYTMKNLFENPGAGVGDKDTKAGTFERPLRDLIVEYLSNNGGTRSTAGEVEKTVAELTQSDLQIYWPYSEDWDGSTMPIITFDPGDNAESNYGYFKRADRNGNIVLDSILVDESVAKDRPVWVVNDNDDCDYTPIVLMNQNDLPQTDTDSRKRILRLRSFKMLRQYDSWFGGASEFRIQLGSVDGFNASTEAELSLYQPSITEFYVVIKRKYVGQDYPYDGIILTDFTNQLDKLAFLVTEDDGGSRTSWKCSATVKVKSKSYGFEIEFPYNEKDDIVWRGQLDASFLQTEDLVSGRFGDTVVTFELD